MHASAQAGTGPLQRFRAAYGRALEWVVGLLMVILALEVTLGIVFRVIGQSLVWYDEVASILLAWLTFYGSALASVNRAHIGCPELVEQLPALPRRAVDILAQLLVIGFFALLGWVGLGIMPMLAGDTLVSLPWVPMNFVQSVIPVSAGLILVGEVMHLVELLGPRRARATHAGAAMPDALH
jgi:TRAP-type C4-dicarboxylate transport system permease small subunit